MNNWQVHGTYFAWRKCSDELLIEAKHYSKLRQWKTNMCNWKRRKIPQVTLKLQPCIEIYMGCLNTKSKTITQVSWNSFYDCPMLYHILWCSGNLDCWQLINKNEVFHVMYLKESDAISEFSVCVSIAEISALSSLSAPI